MKIPTHWYTSIEQIAAASAEAGQHYLEPHLLELCRVHALPHVYQGCLFILSLDHEGSRVYRIMYVHETGRITPASGIHRSQRSAEVSALELANALACGRARVSRTQR